MKNKSRYPTLSEILKKKNNFTKEEIATIIIWKTKWFKRWKHKSKKIQIIALKELIENFCDATGSNNVDIIEGKEYAYTNYNDSDDYHDYQDEYDEDDEYDYHEYENNNQIILDIKNPSIISTLHEIAHHIHGNGETKACRWSTQLFKENFPKDFKNLKFKGHLLIKK